MLPLGTPFAPQSTPRPPGCPAECTARSSLRPAVESYRLRVAGGGEGEENGYPSHGDASPSSRKVAWRQPSGKLTPGPDPALAPHPFWARPGALPCEAG